MTYSIMCKHNTELAVKVCCLMLMTKAQLH